MLTKDIFTISSDADFHRVALDVFNFQYQNVAAYRRFCKLLKVDKNQVKSLMQIPFLPIQFFKNQDIIAKGFSTEKTFLSSGTTGSITSKHNVADLKIYEESFLRAFHSQYGDPKDLVILALLPAYLERDGSSLIYMVDRLIKETDNAHSGFYLDETEALIEKLELLEKNGQPTLLLGVSYALLDLLENKNFELKHTIIMETGGMKGRRKELIKEELHTILMKGFGVKNIHSEYGMTELLSQAYSKGDGIFDCPPWMRILVRETEDALSYHQNRTGGVNVIDLANVYSCAFIATQDLGKVYEDRSFEILGRFDSSDIRGCNLMIF